MKSMTISHDESMAFARLSGDFNPLHIDTVGARRFRYGGTVVHGVHVLLAAIDAELADAATPLRLKSLQATFTAPIMTGTSFSVDPAEVSDADISLRVTSGSVVAQELRFLMVGNDERDSGLADDRAWDSTEARELAFEAVTGGQVPLRLHSQLAKDLFPSVCARLPARQIAVILATTRIVGMECPGLHSVFADLALSFERPATGVPDELVYRVVRSDRRFNMVCLAVAGPGVDGKVTAFFRAKPVAQAAFDEIRPRVDPMSFLDQRALVIGGSRGLGEVMAKALAAGGADVLISYHRGSVDAARVAAEIVASGGSCRPVHYDVGANAADVAEILPSGWNPTHVYYFSSPHIRLNRGPWEPALFDLFCLHYVHGFAAIVERLESSLRLSGSKRSYVYPSSVYVGEMAPGLYEYASAKAAGEQLCSALAHRMRKHIEVVVVRLPRLLTDQTASNNTLEPASTFESILSLAQKAKRVDTRG